MTDPTSDGDAIVDGEVLDGSDALADELATADDTADVPAGDARGGTPSVEDLLSDALSDLEKVSAERDEFLDRLQRERAEFENYKRRVEGQRIELAQRAAESLVVDLLPVLDACEAAISHGHDDVAPIQAALFTTLQKGGLALVDAVDATFDPTFHDAVLTEPGEAAADGPVVTEVMRTGYAWNGRVVRPAMVKVRG